MFDQKKYINEYLKDNYKTIKIRIRYDDIELINKVNNKKNINKYICDLIRRDINEYVEYNFINNNVKINFDLTKELEDLINKAEKADHDNNYGLYMNLADAIDVRAKKEVSLHNITYSDWNKLTRRYPL